MRWPVPPQILVIAVLMKGILHRSFSVFQWEALILLVAGITVNQLNYCAKGGTGAVTAPLPVFCSCAPTCMLLLSLLRAPRGLRSHGQAKADCGGSVEQNLHPGCSTASDPEDGLYP